MRLRGIPVLAVCCLAVGAVLAAACGGGGSPANTAPDSSKVATATLPATLPSPQIISGAVQTGGASSYTVREGDTLAGIAAQFGVSLNDLRAANPSLDPSRLTIGTSVKLPPQASGAPSTPAPAATRPAATATPSAAQPTEPPVTATAGPTITPMSLGQTYTVQAGDIPVTIAQKFGITVQALLAANPSIDPTNLQIGQVLIIPPKQPG